MNVADTLERKVLFRLTRFLALLIVVLMFAGLAIAAYAAVTSWAQVPSTSVGPQVVLDAIRPAPNSSPRGELPEQRIGDEDPALSGFTLPKFLYPQFAPRNQPMPANAGWTDPETRESNRHALAGWMAGFTSTERQTFVNEMANAAIAAQKAGLSVEDAINNYARIKLGVMEDAKTQRAASEVMIKWVAAAAGGVLLLMAMFSLVLVLLAIERNTRASEASGA